MGSRWLGRSIGQKFLNDPMMKYYFIIQCINALLGFVFVFTDAPIDEETGNRVIDGFSLALAMFLPPVEIYLLHKMRKEQLPQKVRNWGTYYLVFFAVMAFVSTLALAGLGVMIFAPEEGAPAMGISDYLMGVMMIVSCLYYLFMGLSARQLGTLMENKEVRHNLMLVLVIVIALVVMDELVQLFQTLFTLNAFTVRNMLGFLNSVLAITGRTMIALLFFRAYQGWKEIASGRL